MASNDQHHAQRKDGHHPKNRGIDCKLGHVTFAATCAFLWMVVPSVVLATSSSVHRLAAFGIGQKHQHMEATTMTKAGRDCHPFLRYNPSQLLSSSTRDPFHPRSHPTSIKLFSSLFDEMDAFDDGIVTSSSTSSSATTTTPPPPIVFSAGYSGEANLLQAIQEAVTMAIQQGLPEASSSSALSTPRVVDLCIVTVSSLYDGAIDFTPASTTVPAILASASTLNVDIRHIVGCSSAGAISSRTGASTSGTASSVSTTDSAGTATATATSTSSSSSSKSSAGKNTANRFTSACCETVELEGIPAVSVTLAMLPDCTLHTFHVAAADIPEADGQTSAAAWKRAVGVSQVGLTVGNENDSNESTTASSLSSSPPLFWLFPSPAFATSLDALLAGLAGNFPGSTVMGGIASTVSSLSRAKVYKWSKNLDTSDVAFGDGCVGVALTGDVTCQSLTVLGAKPVGGIYQILKGQDTTIQIIVLDERATDALNEEESEEKEEDDDEEEDDEIDEGAKSPAEAKEALAQVYAKARIPKPVLAEANFLMRTLSDNDQAFMRRQLLVGLDQGGSVGRSASELARLAAGLGHRFTVYPVVSAGMKDGSVTLALGSVQITPGTRLRFFVRDSEFAQREVEALWTGYKKRVLNDQFARSSSMGSEAGKSMSSFAPACCFLVPTLDRGSKFFQGRQQCYESSTASRMLPGVQCVSGFFSNGIIGLTSGGNGASDELQQPNYGVQGSASAYFLLGSKSGRPVYSAAAEASKAREAASSSVATPVTDLDTGIIPPTATAKESAPKYDNGELIIKRREVHSGRALTVSAVEWSVAEKAAKPSSALEGFMWDKETEVDRFRERVPLADLASQCRALAAVAASSSSSVNNPDMPFARARDWIGPVAAAATSGQFVIVPECKRTDPASGPLRRRYEVARLSSDFTVAGAPALSVNCDAVLFGGSIDHIAEAKNAASETNAALALPVLASDLILYPYQLYKLRLAGADAVNLLVGALAASKDVFYLIKIASSLSLQTLVTVTSTVQIDRVTEALPPGSLQGVVVSNRILEDFTMDETGEQALALLKSDSLQALRTKHGNDILVLAEGRVGLIERKDDLGQLSTAQYLKELQEAGAVGAIVGSGLASSDNGGSEDAIRLLQQQANNAT